MAVFGNPILNFRICNWTQKLAYAILNFAIIFLKFGIEFTNTPWLVYLENNR